VAGLSLGVIVVIVPSTKIENLLPLVPGILDALTRIQPGQILLVSWESDQDGT
jgi:hypothetical protein